MIRERKKRVRRSILHVLGMDDDLWARVRGLGNETWNGCERVELLVVLTRLRETEIIFLVS